MPGVGVQDAGLGAPACQWQSREGVGDGMAGSPAPGSARGSPELSSQLGLDPPLFIFPLLGLGQMPAE